MIIYQFALPLQTNDKARSYNEELFAWEQQAALEAGGYTDLGPRRGVWRDSDGKTYDEQMACYQIAVPEGALGDDIRRSLLEAAFVLFTDQVAFYVAQVGIATITERMSREDVTP